MGKHKPWFGDLSVARTVAMDPMTAWECADLCGTAVGQMLGVQKYFNNITPLRQFGPLFSGYSLAWDFDQAGARMSDSLGKHAKVLTDLATAFENTNQTMQKADGQSAADLGHVTGGKYIDWTDFTVPKNGDGAKWNHTPPPTLHYVDGVAPKTHTHHDTHVKSPGKMAGEFPEDNTPNPHPGSPADQTPPTETGFKPDVNPHAGYHTILTHDGPQLHPTVYEPHPHGEDGDSTDWETLRQLGQEIPGCTNAITATIGVWQWAAAELNDITGYTAYQIFQKIYNWKGKGRDAIYSAIYDYRDQSQQLVTDAGNMYTNLNNAKTTLLNTQPHMPTRKISTYSTSSSSSYAKDLWTLNNARWAIGTIYTPGFQSAAKAIPVLAPPTGLANSKTPGPGPGPRPVPGPGPGPGTATPSATIPTPSLPKDPRSPSPHQLPDQPRNTTQAQQNPSGDGLQQAAQALQQAAGAGQQALTGAQQADAAKSTEAAAADDANLASALPGLAGVGGADSAGRMAGALGKAAGLESGALQASALFPRASVLSAAEEAASTRAGLAGGSTPGSPGTAGARGNQEKNTDRKPKVYLESREYLTEAMGQPIIGSVPVVEE